MFVGSSRGWENYLTSMASENMSADFCQVLTSTSDKKNRRVLPLRAELIVCQTR